MRGEICIYLTIAKYSMRNFNIVFIFVSICVMASVAIADVEILSPRGDMIMPTPIDPMTVPVIIENAGNETEYVVVEARSNGSAKIEFSTTCKVTDNDTEEKQTIESCVTIEPRKTARFELEISDYQFGEWFRIEATGAIELSNTRFIIFDGREIEEDGGEEVIIFVNETPGDKNASSGVKDITVTPVDDDDVEETETISEVEKQDSDDGGLPTSVLIMGMVGVVVAITIVILRMGTKQKSVVELKESMITQLKKKYKTNVDVRMFTQTSDGWDSIVMIEGKPRSITLNQKGKVKEDNELSEDAWVA